MEEGDESGEGAGVLGAPDSVAALHARALGLVHDLDAQTCGKEAFWRGFEEEEGGAKRYISRISTRGDSGDSESPHEKTSPRGKTYLQNLHAWRFWRFRRGDLFFA